MSEPRVDPRARVRVPIQVLDADTHAPRTLIETVDLSAGGAFCRAAEEVPLKSQIRIELPDSKGSPPILTEAIVLRVDRDTSARAGVGGFLIALYFLNLRFADRQRLQRFIFAQLSSEHATT